MEGMPDDQEPQAGDEDVEAEKDREQGLGEGPEGWDELEEKADDARS